MDLLTKNFLKKFSSFLKKDQWGHIDPIYFEPDNTEKDAQMLQVYIAKSIVDLLQTIKNV